MEGSERAGAEGDEDAAAAAEDAGLERYGQLAQHIASLYAGRGRRHGGQRQREVRAADLQ